MPNSIGVIQLNRPKALNALNYALLIQMNNKLIEFDRDPEVKVVVMTGNEKAFAAGVDIKDYIGMKSA